MVSILTWVSIVAGGLLILLMLLSLIGGLDFDFEIESPESDLDSSGGLGVVKGALTFISVSSWVVKVLMATKSNIAIAISIGVISGALAILLLNYIFKLLLKNEENVNWKMNDSLYQNGTVYLKIPTGTGSGLVHVDINGAIRELKAKTRGKKAISTGANITVTDVDGDYVYVEPAS